MKKLMRVSKNDDEDLRALELDRKAIMAKESKEQEEKFQRLKEKNERTKQKIKERDEKIKNKMMSNILKN